MLVAVACTFQTRLPNQEKTPNKVTVIKHAQLIVLANATFVLLVWPVGSRFS